VPDGQIRRICVFCGSNQGNDARFAETATAAGRLLAERRIGLVYGGGNIGLMGRVADAALDAGGEVIGVIPHALALKEVAHDGLNELHVVDTMHERKAMMADLSDAFLALPGGLGTLEEIFETVTWAQLGIHTKPCGFLNIAGYYDRLIAFLDHCVQCGMIQPRYRQMILVDEEIGSLLAGMVAYESPAVERWVTRDQL
jgi:uncharacterized protein (TIGR00730 family)